MEERYHLLVESISDYAIFMLDTHGHVATWNVGAERLKGYAAGEVIGQHFSIFFPPDDRASGKPERELGIALSTGRYEEEGTRLRKDGTRFYANVILTPLYDEGGSHVGFAKITRDLTEKKRNEELYLLMVSQVTDYAIFMLDTEGKVLTWNEGAERIKGYAAHEIIGKNFSVFYPEEEIAAAKPTSVLVSAVRTGRYEEEGWRVRKDGSSFWANVVISPVYTDRHVGYAKVTRDLTQRRELERLNRANAVLDATNKELERFASIASHDLKEPLRKISAFTGMVLGDDAHPLAEKQRGYLQRVRSSAERMTMMVDGILELSTLSSKEHFESRSLSQLAQETLELLEQTVADKTAVVRLEELPSAVVLPSQMRRLFQNLFSNSLKFAKRDAPPEITVSYRYAKPQELNLGALWDAEQYLCVTFKDNGIGFEQEHAERIFNMFDRLHARSAYEGSGLGLAICRKIAENHGGAIVARSEPGSGAEFTLVLPA